MKFPCVILVVALAATAVCAAEPRLEPLAPAPDLSAFVDDGAAAQFWRWENGVLIGQSLPSKKEHYLWTRKEYGDFVLEFDARWSGVAPRGADTGIEMRKPHLQLQLGVSGSLKVDMTGSWYTGGKPAYPEAGQAKTAKELLKPDGQWNHFRIEARGDSFACWINGLKASEYQDAKFSGPGPLGFQIHGGVEMKVEFRELRIAPL